MGNPANGFGIFSVERDPEASSLGLGRRSYGSEGSCYVWKGRYYLQIIASDATKQLQHITIALARRLTSLLSDSGETVRGLTLLPREGLVPNSEHYYRVNALGMHFMKNTYVAQYRKSNQLVTVFLSEKSRPDLARDTISQYVQFAEQSGESAETLKQGDPEIMLFNMGTLMTWYFRKADWSRACPR